MHIEYFQDQQLKKPTLSKYFHTSASFLTKIVECSTLAH